MFSCDRPLYMATRFDRALVFPAAILGVP